MPLWSHADWLRSPIPYSCVHPFMGLRGPSQAFERPRGPGPRDEAGSTGFDRSLTGGVAGMETFPRTSRFETAPTASRRTHSRGGQVIRYDRRVSIPLKELKKLWLPKSVLR